MRCQQRPPRLLALGVHRPSRAPDSEAHRLAGEPQRACDVHRPIAAAEARNHVTLARGQLGALCVQQARERTQGAVGLGPEPHEYAAEPVLSARLLDRRAGVVQGGAVHPERLAAHRRGERPAPDPPAHLQLGERPLEVP